MAPSPSQITAVSLTNTGQITAGAFRVDFQPALTGCADAQADRWMYSDNLAVGATISHTGGWLSTWGAFDLVLTSGGQFHARVDFTLANVAPPTGTAPDQPAPANYIAPPPLGATDIPGLSKGVDDLERKLDAVLGILRYLSSNPTPIGASTLPPVDAAAGPVISAGAAGFIVTTTNLGPDVSERFGSPARLHRVGHVALGTAAGWFPPIDIDVTPMVLAPLPPGVDRISVVVEPPSTATVAVMVPPK